jgi:hypothetical protein
MAGPPRFAQPRFAHPLNWWSLTHHKASGNFHAASPVGMPVIAESTLQGV